MGCVAQTEIEGNAYAAAPNSDEEIRRGDRPADTRRHSRHDGSEIGSSATSQQSGLSMSIPCLLDCKGPDRVDACMYPFGRTSCGSFPIADARICRSSRLRQLYG